MYNPRAVSLCLSLVLLLRIAKVPPPSRSPALLCAWRAYPFFLHQHIDVFAAVSVSKTVLDFVIAASAMPDRSPIDFSTFCGLRASLMSCVLAGRCLCLWRLLRIGVFEVRLRASSRCPPTSLRRCAAAKKTGPRRAVI